MEQELWKYLKTAQKPIVLYGMGNGADKIIKVLEKYEIPFKGVFASDGFVRNKLFHGFEISSYSTLKQKFGDMIVLLCFGSERPEVLENIKKIAAEQELYAPDVPVIGDELFCEEFYSKNKDSFDWVYERLADDTSKKTFINTIKYKLSGKIDYLLDCEISENEPYESFLKLSENESFLDLGAYNGDTVLDFINRVNKYKEIIACEPDSKSFKKLMLNTENVKNITCLNVGVSSKCGKMPFAMKGGRNSATFKGITEIDFLTVDKIAQKREITYIKMDLEGEEEKTIIGAQNTIKNQKPKMLVSCYHRTDDFFTLPKQVLSINPHYKLYMRHFPSLPAWDINFYFV